MQYCKPDFVATILLEQLVNSMMRKIVVISFISNLLIMVFQAFLPNTDAAFYQTQTNFQNLWQNFQTEKNATTFVAKKSF